MIENYLNQSVTWEKKTGINAYNEPMYADPVEIKVRYEGKQKFIKTLTGKEVVSEAQVTTVAKVKPEDLINGKEVITYSDVVNLDGTMAMRRLFL